MSEPVNSKLVILPEGENMGSEKLFELLLVKLLELILRKCN